MKKNNSIEIFKIEVHKANVVLSRNILVKKVFFENEKEYKKYWRLHSKRLSTKHTMQMCGYKLTIKDKEFCWEVINEYPKTNQDNNKSSSGKSKNKKQYSFDFISSEETKKILNKLTDKEDLT